MEITNENSNVAKQRHGCVTAWLVIMIIFNSITALIYLFASNLVMQRFSVEVSTQIIILLGIIGIGNVISSVLLLLWQKIGFWGFVVTSIATLIINLTIGLSIWQSAIGLIGILVLYGVLQIKKDDVPAWKNLK